MAVEGITVDYWIYETLVHIDLTNYVIIDLDLTLGVFIARLEIVKVLKVHSNYNLVLYVIIKRLAFYALFSYDSYTNIYGLLQNIIWILQRILVHNYQTQNRSGYEIVYNYGNVRYDNVSVNVVYVVENGNVGGIVQDYIYSISFLDI